MYSAIYMLSWYVVTHRIHSITDINFQKFKICLFFSSSVYNYDFVVNQYLWL